MTNLVKTVKWFDVWIWVQKHCNLKFPYQCICQWNRSKMPSDSKSTVRFRWNICPQHSRALLHCDLEGKYFILIWGYFCHQRAFCFCSSDKCTGMEITIFLPTDSNLTPFYSEFMLKTNSLIHHPLTYL